MSKTKEWLSRASMMMMQHFNNVYQMISNWCKIIYSYWNTWLNYWQYSHSACFTYIGRTENERRRAQHDFWETATNRGVRQKKKMPIYFCSEFISTSELVELCPPLPFSTRSDGHMCQNLCISKIVQQSNSMGLSLRSIVLPPFLLPTDFSHKKW